MQKDMDLQSDDHERFIVPTKEARQDIRKLDAEFRRFREILYGIHYFLKRQAHSGELVFDQIYYYCTSKFPDAPPIEVYYTFDDKSVTIYGVAQVEEDVDESD